MTMIEIFHNTAHEARTRGYQPCDVLVAVFRLPSDPRFGPDETRQVESLFTARSNREPCPDGHTRRYFARGNRVLRVGDAIAVDGVFLVRTEYGWQVLGGSDPRIGYDRARGTVPLLWPRIRRFLPMLTLFLAAITTILFISRRETSVILWMLHPWQFLPWSGYGSPRSTVIASGDPVPSSSRGPPTSRHLTRCRLRPCFRGHCAVRPCVRP